MAEYIKRSIVVVAFAVILSLCSCDINARESVRDKDAPSRFVLVERCCIFDVVYDRETKVMYTVSTDGRNSGNVTVLVDNDGKPLLYEKE